MIVPKSVYSRFPILSIPGFPSTDSFPLIGRRYTPTGFSGYFSSFQILGAWGIFSDLPT
jgi:hypothetical protein